VRFAKLQEFLDQHFPDHTIIKLSGTKVEIVLKPKVLSNPKMPAYQPDNDKDDGSSGIGSFLIALGVGAIFGSALTK
jgi:hypothetical protein